MYEKYITALQLMDNVVATKVTPGYGPNGIANRYRNLHPTHVAWDICFNFIFENFRKPETALVGGFPPIDKHREIDLASELIYRNSQLIEFEKILRAIPPVLSEEIFPVAVFRYLMHDMEIVINHRKLNTISQCLQWYSTMLMMAHE